jgi:hypothetical protein
MIAMVYCVEHKRHSFLIYRLKKEYDHGFLSHLSFLPCLPVFQRNVGYEHQNSNILYAAYLTIEQWHSRKTIVLLLIKFMRLHSKKRDVMVTVLHKLGLPIIQFVYYFIDGLTILKE